MPATLGELAERFGCEVGGDPDILIKSVGTLSGAAPTAISFLANRLYRDRLPATQAGAVILEERERSECPTAVLIAANPYAV